MNKDRENFVIDGGPAKAYGKWAQFLEEAISNSNGEFIVGRAALSFKAAEFVLSSPADFLQDMAKAGMGIVILPQGEHCVIKVLKFKQMENVLWEEGKVGAYRNLFNKAIEGIQSGEISDEEELAEIQELLGEMYSDLGPGTKRELADLSIIPQNLSVNWVQRRRLLED
jgi:hypothetical protein